VDTCGIFAALLQTLPKRRNEFFELALMNYVRHKRNRITWQKLPMWRRSLRAWHLPTFTTRQRI